MKTAPGKSAGRPATISLRASIPPAEAPIMMMSSLCMAPDPPAAEPIDHSGSGRRPG